MQLRQSLQTRIGRIISGLLGLAIVIVLVTGLLWATNTFGWRKWRVIEAQQFIDTELPPEAQDIQFATDDKKTRILWLHFTLPAETDLTSFFGQLGLDATLRQDFTPFPAPNPAEATLTWWTPQAAQTHSGLYAIHAGKVYELLVDQSDTNNLTIFLRVYAIGME
jgi:cytoskeletal protein RodZ